MTRAERVKLARAARELASEYAEGRGPYVTNAGGWCGCVAGAVALRSGVSCPAETAASLDADFLAYTLTAATAHHVGQVGYPHIHGAVVFPLLALATELDGKIV